MNGDTVGRVRVRYGWVELVVIGGIVLLFLWTFFLCIAIRWDWHLHLHLDESSNEPNVIVTASPGFVSISSEILDDSNTLQVATHSSVPVDAVVKTKDGRHIFTYLGLMPGESFYFEYAEPCIVTASVS